MKPRLTGIINTVRNIYKDTPIFIILLGLIVVSCILVPNFLSPYNIRTFFLQSADLLVISCGLTFVVLNGGIDFSITSILSLGSVVGAYIMKLSPLASNPAISIPVAILAILLVGAVVGVVNGLAVSRLRMPSFIATLATQLFFSGVALIFLNFVTGGKTSITALPPAFLIIGGSGDNFYVPVIIAYAAWGFCYWLLKYTIFGRNLYAIGVNHKTAYVSGINVKKMVLSIMLLAGIFAAIECVILTARNNVGISDMGDNKFITIIAAVIVGGTSTAGGFGGFKQTLIGVLFITLIDTSMTLLSVDISLITLMQGILILLSTMLGAIGQSGKKREKLIVMEAKK